MNPSERSIYKGNLRGIIPVGEENKKVVEEWDKRATSNICNYCGKPYKFRIRFKNNKCYHD